ncbi:MAG: hypothetical protein HQ582_24625 [Planctomycetes bacterium]|nr:hypothetical protein [Planctomycetota bacterium]
MSHPGWLSTIVALAALTAPAKPACAQAANTWRPPDASYRLDFGSDESGRRVVFLDKGMALEVTLDFMMIKQKRVPIAAVLPEPGSFSVEQTNPKALVDVVKSGANRFDVVARFSAMSLADANARAGKAVKALGKPITDRLRPDAQRLSRAELSEFLREHEWGIPTAAAPEEELRLIREAYLAVRTVEELGPEMRLRLGALAAKRPKWISETDRTAWEDAAPQSLLEDYLLLLPYEILDDHQHAVGIEFDGDIRSFKRRLESRARALRLVLNGNAGLRADDAAEVTKILGAQERSDLRAALTVNLRCHFLPQVDPKDANARWYNAQRLAAGARGVASTRVEGQLDPARNDRVDWWFVEGDRTDVASFRKSGSGGFRVDPPYFCEGGARLRVTATGSQRADYTLEFRASGASPDELNVVIHESASVADSKHPF